METLLKLLICLAVGISCMAVLALLAFSFIYLVGGKILIIRIIILLLFLIGVGAAILDI